MSPPNGHAHGSAGSADVLNKSVPSAALLGMNPAPQFKSLNQVNDLETLQKIVLVIEAKAGLVPQHP